MTIDGRGRIYLPVWMRRHPGLLIGARAPDEPAVVMVPAAVVDAIADELLERVR